LLLALMAAFLINNFLTANKQKTFKLDILTAKFDMRKGDKIVASALDSMPIDASVYADWMVTTDRQNQVINYFTAIDIKKGQPIIFNALQLQQRRREPLAPLIPAGLRAVSIPVTNISSVSGLIERGDRVDILIALDVPVFTKETMNVQNVGNVPLTREQKEKVLVYLLQDITVVATGRSIMEDVSVTALGEEVEGGYETVSITITPEEAAVVGFANFAADEGGAPFYLLLRNPTDNTILERPQITKMDNVLDMTNLDFLLKKGNQIRRPERIETGTETTQ